MVAVGKHWRGNPGSELEIEKEIGECNIVSD